MSRPNVHGLPEHLRKDAKGYFLDYYVQVDGVTKRKRERLGLITLTQAKLVLAKHSQTIVEKKYLAGKPKVKFFEAADSFLAYSKARKRSHRGDVSMVGLLKAYFGDRSLESFNSDLVEAYIAHRMQEGKGRDGKIKGTTLNRDIACLKTIMRRAVMNRWIEWNPIQGVRKFKEQSRDRTLEPEEYRRLLENCTPYMRNIVQLAYVSGMRRGEILGLRWDQVDLKNRVIRLEAADTKTQERREIPLSGAMVQVLEKIPRTLGNPLVFTFRGQKVFSVKTAFMRACRAAKIEDFRFHDLRHCAVTNFRKAGVPDSVIMSISGHKTNAVFRRYDRVDRADRELAIQRAQVLIDTNWTLTEELATAKKAQ